MSREAFIEDIVSQLLTQVEPQVLALMASEGRETRSGNGFSSLGELAGGQNLGDPRASLYIMLNEVQRTKFRDIFANRYRRMIREFIELKEKLLHHQKIPDSEFRAEIINYITRSDSALGRSIYQVAASQSVTSAVRQAYSEALPHSYTGRFQENSNLSDRVALDRLLKNVTMTSISCNQRFSDVKTSDKGMVQLTGSGKPFIFEACHIAEVLPCNKAESQSDFAFIFDTIKLISGEDLPRKTIHTAVRMRGKYDGVNFVEVDFETAFPKLSEAIRVSSAIQKKRHGEFK